MAALDGYRSRTIGDDFTTGRWAAPNPNQRTTMNQNLTLDDVRRVAPAAFTAAPAVDLTKRYAHVTTADVLQRLQGNGWAITQARQGRL